MIASCSDDSIAQVKLYATGLEWKQHILHETESSGGAAFI